MFLLYLCIAIYWTASTLATEASIWTLFVSELIIQIDYKPDLALPGMACNRTCTPLSKECDRSHTFSVQMKIKILCLSDPKCQSGRPKSRSLNDLIDIINLLAKDNPIELNIT